MLKVTHPMISKHYGKCLRTIKYKAEQFGGIKNLDSLYKVLDFYEKKKVELIEKKAKLLIK